MGRFYRWWVLPVAAVTWFGGSFLLLLIWWPIGVIALLVAAILFEGLLSHRSAEQSSGGRDHEAAQ